MRTRHDGVRAYLLSIDSHDSVRSFRLRRLSRVLLSRDWMSEASEVEIDGIVYLSEPMTRLQLSDSLQILPQSDAKTVMCVTEADAERRTRLVAQIELTSALSEWQ
jgi:hypothetical protein